MQRWIRDHGLIVFLVLVAVALIWVVFFLMDWPNDLFSSKPYPMP